MRFALMLEPRRAECAQTPPCTITVLKSKFASKRT
jgi:hypothetical protein